MAARFLIINYLSIYLSYNLVDLNGKCVFPGQFDTHSSITIDTDLATIDPRNDSYPGSSSLFKQSSFHSACTSAYVRACVRVCVCVYVSGEG